MIIDVEKLKNNSGLSIEIEAVIPKDSFSDELKLTEDGVLKATAKSDNRRIYLKGEFRGKFLFSCDLCGENAYVDIVAPVDECYTNVKATFEDDEDGEIRYFEGTSIDITYALEQSVFLELPMKILCNENCKGLCPDCGCNLNKSSCDCANNRIDPRLAALASFVLDDAED